MHSHYVKLLLQIPCCGWIKKLDLGTVLIETHYDISQKVHPIESAGDNMFDLLEFLKEPNLVIYGCGANAKHLINEMPQLADSIVECVDNDANRNGGFFLGKWIIKSPSIINKNKHKVIVTPNDCGSIVDNLENCGFSRNCDYIVLKSSEFQMAVLKNLYETVKQYRNHLLFVFHAVTNHIRNPSPTEQVLMRYDLIIKDRIAWLKNNPPHVSQSHNCLPHYSDAYIENIFTGLNPIEQNGALFQSDHRSEYVNVIGGLRVTTDHPDKFIQRVHMIGPSYTYGFGVEDKYTTSSCLQRLLNDHFPDTFIVINHGVRGLPIGKYRPKINSIDIQDDDIIIITVDYNSSFKEYLSLNGIPFIDLAGIIQRPHSFGEIFYDSGHMNFKGNIAISEKIIGAFDSIFLCDANNMKNSINPHVLTKDDFSLDPIVIPEFNGFIDNLKKNKVASYEESVIGSIVMNCNPFTFGHYHLIDVASQIVDYLYVFIVEEDKSIFPFKDRFDLVQKGASSLKNVKLLPSGKYIISNITFPEYFDKDNKQKTSIDASLDLHTFGKHIAPVLGITIRFVGEEPLDMVTKQYNETMKAILPRYGIDVIKIPRKKHDGETISASRVRALLKGKKFNEIAELVPQTTLDYLKEKFG